MTITLPPDLEEELRAEVAAGRAKSVDSVVTTALRAYLKEVAEFRASLDAVEAQADREGWIDGEQVFAEMRARLKAR
jgi:Arc/MetJ-type ribon-helix-helix transcriptional regulator